jgi:glutathione-specific gamma-glutamylcyclotransferase
MSRRAKMTLTAELVERVHRVVADSGPPSGFVALTDHDYDVWRRALLAEHPKGADLWLFAYGSLIWKPACEVEDHGLALLRGWHRKFCLHLKRFRGTPDFPGLMMALDRGGSCRGVLQRIPARHIEERLDLLLRRETSVKPASNTPQWVRVESSSKSQRAIAFTINRKGPTYCRHTLAETAEVLAKACGHWGTGAEYLLHTVAHLEARGIHDPYLWKLQRMVAQLIEASWSGAPVDLAKRRQQP